MACSFGLLVLIHAAAVTAAPLVGPGRGMARYWEVPFRRRAPPIFPVVQVAASCTAPELPAVEESAAVLPEFSSSFHQPTRPAGTGRGSSARGGEAGAVGG